MTYEAEVLTMLQKIIDEIKKSTMATERCASMLHEQKEYFSLMDCDLDD